MNELAVMIRDARKKLGLKQVELGHKIGIQDEAAAQVMISQYETGERFPQKHLVKLIEVLSLPKRRVVDLMLEHTQV
jgi:transcriptional regulator with XRE-family HTH domain